MQKVLIWSAYYWNKSKTFWFGPKKFVSQAYHFRYSPKIQSNLIWSGNCLSQSRTFLFNPKTYRSMKNLLIWSANYPNKSKTFWFGPLIIRKKAKQFDLLPKYTLHIHTAGDWKEYSLHVQIAGCRNGYIHGHTMHGHTAGDVKGYAVHVQTAGCGKGLDPDSIARRAKMTHKSRKFF